MDFSAMFIINEKIQLFAQHYLLSKGWYWSLAGMPRDQEGYIPWITYPAIMQLGRLVKPTHKVFEFGCGGSSLWWAKRAAEVVSIDHDAEWLEKVREEKPANLTLIAKEMDAPCDPKHMKILKPFFEIKDIEFPLWESPSANIHSGLVNDRFTAYVAELLKYPKGHFDIICVDGMARIMSAWLAAEYVKEDGIIVFDNADRWVYTPAFHLLARKGFKRIDFYGPCPMNVDESCTSIFTKNLNFFADNIDVPNKRTV